MGKKVAGQPEDDPYLDVKRDAMVEAREAVASDVRQLTIGRFCLEIHAEVLRMSAEEKFMRYSTLVEAGFTTDQAMTLLIHDS